MAKYVKMYFWEESILTFHDILFCRTVKAATVPTPQAFVKSCSITSTYFTTVNLPNMSLLRAAGGDFQHILYQAVTLHSTDCFYERVCWAGSAVSWTACLPFLGNSKCTYSEHTLETSVIVNHKLTEQKVRRKNDWNCLQQRGVSDGTSRSNKRYWMSSK